jgi:hypothetical protein
MNLISEEKMKRRILYVAASSIIALGACAQMGGKSEGSSGSGAAPAPAPKPQAQPQQDPNLPPMKLVKARDGSFDGELYGTPAPGSKFAKLQFGMGLKEVQDNIQMQCDMKGYVTGKAWIPWYFGGDRHRFELFCKGEGRLIFSGGSGFGDVNKLIKIIVDPKETGYAR